MKKFGAFLKSFVSVMLIIISIVLLHGYILLQGASNLLAKDTIANMVKEMDIVELVGEEGKDELYQSLEETGIPKEYADSVLENESLKELASDFLSGAIGYAIDGTEMPKLEAEQLSTTLKDVVKGLDSSIISEKEKENVLKEIDKNMDEIVKLANEMQDELTAELGEDSTLREDLENDPSMKLVLNVYDKRVLFLVGAGVALLIVALLNLKQFKFMKWLGTTAIVNGVSFLFVWKAIPTLAYSLAAEEIKEVKSIFDVALKAVTNTYLIAAIIAFVLGILFITGYILIKKYKKVPLEETVNEN